MSYGVHIIRIKQGAHEELHAITLDEWLAYVSSDEEMHLKGEAIFKGPKGETIKYDAPGMTEWVDPQTGSKALFDHSTPMGGVSVGNPSYETLVKMFKVAKALGAIVQGDEGECYDAAGSPL
jgi:hypothetical protein